MIRGKIRSEAAELSQGRKDPYLLSGKKFASPRKIIDGGVSVTPPTLQDHYEKHN